MKKEIYKKILEDRIENIQRTLKNIDEKLRIGEISYIEYLYLEKNLYSSMVETQHELYSLKYVVEEE